MLFSLKILQPQVLPISNSAVLVSQTIILNCSRLFALKRQNADGKTRWQKRCLQVQKNRTGDSKGTEIGESQDFYSSDLKDANLSHVKVMCHMRFCCLTAALMDFAPRILQLKP